jgi:hypothetical protein
MRSRIEIAIVTQLQAHYKPVIVPRAKKRDPG